MVQRARRIMACHGAKVKPGLVPGLAGSPSATDEPGEGNSAMNETTDRMTSERLAAEFGLSIRAEFVPLSRSRNAGKWESLNWKITLLKARPGADASEILTTDYSAGSGHCPADKIAKLPAGCHIPLKHYKADAIKFECETGREAKHSWGGNLRAGSPILPDAADVVYSLCMDGGAIDCAGFEDWAREYGYDVDSRKAESDYRICLDIGLKLRAALGESMLSKLREAFQDF
jgi:hypothetical protein